MRDNFNLLLAPVFLSTLAVFFWFVTYGTGNIFGNSPEVWGTAFDHLGMSLLTLRADVPAESIGIEGLRNGGKTYIYFGIFPALLRILLNTIDPAGFGLWSRLSCFLAIVICYFCIAATVHLGVHANRALSRGERRFWLMLAVSAAGVGSPLLFLISDSMIFNEAIAWGLCFSLLSSYQILSAILNPARERRYLVLAGMAAAAALLSRITFAMPLYMILMYLIFSRGRAQTARTQQLFFISSTAAPPLIGVFIQLWYNWARFGSPLVTLVYQMVTPNPAQYGGEFNFFRIPVALFNFLWIRSDSFSAEPTYFASVKPLYLSDRLYAEWSERIVPLSVSCPWLVAALLATIVLAARGALSKDLRVIFAAYGIQALMILSWHFITERYSAEFMPLFVFSIFCFLCTRSKDVSKVGKTAAFSLSLLSVVATPLSTIDFHLLAVGDTGLQKENRPLLNSMFYAPILSARPISLASSCSIESAQSVRGQKIAPSYEVPVNCSVRFFVPEREKVELSVALSDATHECEGYHGRFIIRDSSGTETYRSQDLTQRSRLQTLTIPFIEGEIEFEGDAAPCVRVVLIRS